MKDKISSLDYSYLVRELQFLVNSRLDKLNNDEETWYFEFYVPSKGKQVLKVVLGKYVCLTPEKGAGFGNFCEYLRKYLQGAKIKAIRQLDSERIIQIDFELRSQQYSLVIEMFSKGNLIFLGSEQAIMRALENQTFRDREVKPGITYKYPRSKYNVLEPNKELFKKVLEESAKDSIVKTLATDIGLGGTYAEEACSRAGIDKTKQKLSEKEITQLYEAIISLANAKPNAAIIIDNDAMIDVVPIKLEVYKECKAQGHKTFNDAIQDYFSQLTIKKPSKHEKEIQKLVKIIANEKQTIAEYETQEIEEKQKAEALYANYQLADEILREIKKARQKYSWKEIKEKLKDHKFIKSVNEKEGKVEVEL
ncbi:NFACT family protein [Candidatus Woesearchaeota archaeon]|nr:NFACT family protein [Candidatus Woesearchaeota archaeon]